MRHASLSLKLCIVLLAVSVFLLSPRPVQASSWTHEYTGETLDVGTWFYYNQSLTSGDTISGYIQTDSTSETVTFFICDSANYALWSSGSSATVYNLTNSVHTGSFSVTVPTTDTWYVVASNRQGSVTVTLDLGIDINADNSPYYDPSMYNSTLYCDVLPQGWHHYYYDTYSAGTTLFGHVSTWFSTDGVDVFICDETNYNIWYNGGSPTRYDLETNMHLTPVGPFVVPYSGTWYVVIVNDMSHAITISYGLGSRPETATTTTTTQPSTTTSSPQSSTTTSSPELSTNTLLGIGVLAIVAIVGIAAVRSRRSGPSASPTTPPNVPPAGAQVLVVCPYCGHLNQQGRTTCENCKGDL